MKVKLDDPHKLISDVVCHHEDKNLIVLRLICNYKGVERTCSSWDSRFPTLRTLEFCYDRNTEIGDQYAELIFDIGNEHDFWIFSSSWADKYEIIITAIRHYGANREDETDGISYIDIIGENSKSGFKRIRSR